MKIVIYKDFFKKEWKKKEIEIECNGSGTEEDPIVIESSENLPRSFEIFDSNNKIIMKDFTHSSGGYDDEITWVSLFFSENLSIENCVMDNLYFHLSSHIKIKNLTCRNLILSECQECLLEDCHIEETLAIVKSGKNKIKNCIIDYKFIYNLHHQCRDNTFENNQIPEEFIDSIVSIKCVDKRTFTINGGGFATVSGDSIELEFSGNGTEYDPIILKPSENIPYFMNLYGNRLNLLFKDFIPKHPKRIKFENCRNIIIEYGNLKSKYLRYCSNIRIKNISIKRVELEECQNITFEECEIGTVIIQKPIKNSIVFKNCSITRMKENLINKINIEDTQINKTYSEKSKKSYIIEHKELFEVILILVTVFLYIFAVFIPGILFRLGLIPSLMADILGYGLISIYPIFMISYYVKRAIKKRKKRQWQEKIKKVD